MPKIIVKRIYEPYSPEDGFRVLVDRLWPRGLSREKAKVDLWAKEIAPSSELRKSFHKNPEEGDVFRQHYLAELAGNTEAPQFLQNVRESLKKGPVTLLYAAKEPRLSHAFILKAWLEERGV